MADDQAFLSARVPVEMRNRFKALAASKGLPIQDLLREAVETYVHNEETRIPQAQRIIRIIKEHADALRAEGLSRLSLVGSVARGTAHEASDIDLVAEFNETRNFNLIDVGQIGHMLQDYLGDRHKVDLSVRQWLREDIAQAMRRDEIGIL